MVLSCFYNFVYCPIIFSDANQEQLTSLLGPSPSSPHAINSNQKKSLLRSSDSQLSTLISHRQEFCSSLERQPITQPSTSIQKKSLLPSSNNQSSTIIPIAPSCNSLLGSQIHNYYLEQDESSNSQTK
mmetsp:Transcript_19183/g.34682  ORF Transcript_19183/g.34682 Transcript_19183/m.34682 type:complete len:128 (-) Transcript_19183:830-1213(-)